MPGRGGRVRGWSEGTERALARWGENIDSPRPSTYCHPRPVGGGGNFMSKQIQRTPKGLAYIAKWGSLRVASNEAFIALVAAQAGLNPQPYRDFAKGQVRAA